jgi:hypothetical protein
MSLVNDVLRQLDANSAKPCQAMPLHSMMIEQPAKRNKLMEISFILLVVFLFFILTLQILYKKSLVDIFYFNDLNRAEVSQQSLRSIPLNRLLITEGGKESTIRSTSESDRTSKENIKIAVASSGLVASKTIESEVLKISTLKVQAAQDTLEIKNDRMAIIDDYSKTNPVKKEVLIQDAAVKGIRNINANIKNTDMKNDQGYKLDLKEKNNKKVNITMVENIGFKHYQLSLRAYKNKQTSAALSWVDLALATEKKDEYLRLKVRILMQKGERAELHQFILAQNDNTSLDWFQLVAPSLQMYAYYNLSNKYYSELIKQQPNDVKWQLAMALNYSKLEQNERTYSIYKNLLNSSLLTYKQQRWIAKRLGRMEQGKVAINER